MLIANELAHVAQQSASDGRHVGWSNGERRFVPDFAWGNRASRLCSFASTKSGAAERPSDRAGLGKPLEIRITTVAGRIQRLPAYRTKMPCKSPCCIHFVQGRSELTDAKEFARCVKTIRIYLQEGSAARVIELHGYASEEGDDKFNKQLSQRRAKIVELLV